MRWNEMRREATEREAMSMTWHDVAQVWDEEFIFTGILSDFVSSGLSLQVR